MTALESQRSGAAPSAAGGDVVESAGGDCTDDYWNDLPKRVQDCVLAAAAPLAKARLRKDGLELHIVIFILYSSQLFAVDDEYDWNLFRSLRSSYILAAIYLLRKMHDEAILMMFFAAFLEECLSRGYYAAKNKLVPSSGHSSAILNAQGRPALRRLDFVCNAFSSSIYFRYAAINTRSSRTMSAFLKARLKESRDEHMVRRLEALEDEPVVVLHEFDTNGADPEPLMSLNIAKGVALKVYPSTSVKHLFNLSLCVAFQTHFGLLTGKGRLKSRIFSIPCIMLLNKNEAVFLINSGEKTLHEVGIEGGDDVFPSNGKLRLKNREESSDKGTEVKSKGQRARNKGTMRPKGKRKPAIVSSPEQEPSLGELRELHSKAMEPVLNELRPRLKKIKEHIHALSLVKDSPKERRSKTGGKGKENAPNLERSLIPIYGSLGSKAGNTFYPILVGESTDLFKTAQLRPRKALRRITLDLHGYSRYKALGKLRKSLAEWIEAAMKGEYPFVVAVDIICGGGSQVLSEVVAQFIRNSPQIANMPKSIG